MNNSRNKRMIALGATAFLLTAGAAADRAMAYFTTYVEASGGQELHLGFTTTIPSEEVSDWTKNITLSNTGEQSCYARVKVLAGSSYALNFTDHSGGNWSAGADGYYYWHEILPPGGSTGSILAKIENLVNKMSLMLLSYRNAHRCPIRKMERRYPGIRWIGPGKQIS